MTKDAKPPSVADVKWSAFVTRDSLRRVMENAKRQKRDDVYWEAFRRLCSLEGTDRDDPLHREFHATLTAYEELLSEKNGRRTSASRTRQKLANHSLEKCLEDWALAKTPTTGFQLLVEKGLAELTAEYLVVKYADRFPQMAVEAARTRLMNLGVAVGDGL